MIFFLFFKKILSEAKANADSLVSIYFDNLRLATQTKQKVESFAYLYRGMLSFEILQKGMGIDFPPHVSKFFKK